MTINPNMTDTQLDSMLAAREEARRVEREALRGVLTIVYRVTDKAEFRRVFASA